MEGCLPLNPAIPEHFVEDDVGVWVTFGVPAGHYLHGRYVPVDRAALPRDVPVERILGNVFRRAAPPAMNQIRQAVGDVRQERRPPVIQPPVSQVPPLVTQPLVSASTDQTVPKLETRDEQLMELREELARVKAALSGPGDVPYAGGDGPKPDVRRGGTRPVRDGDFQRSRP